MAEAFLEELYQYAEAITTFQQAADSMWTTDVHRATLLLEEQEEKVRRTCVDCLHDNYPGAEELLALVKRVYNGEKDHIVRADLMEKAIIPMLEQWVQSRGSIVQPVDEEWQLESTACGFLTLKNLRTDTYLHSNNNPMEEARKQIEYYYIPSVESYALLGCGLGYQAYQLYRISNGSVKIHLFEQDPLVVELARKYGVLDWIPEDILEVTTKDSVYAYLKTLDEKGDMGAFMHLPSLRLLRNKTEQEAMLEAYGKQHTSLAHKRDFSINFYRNLHSDAEYIDSLPKIGEEAVIVAAGPSLDDCMEVLRRWQGQKTIIAVGTVFHKLLKQGIRPDYVTVSDPQKRTLKQLEGLWEEEIPMILDACAYWEFARKYKGKKYYVLTPQFQELLAYAKEHELDVWPSGGTVMSLGVEVGIRRGAKKIYLMGVDLAYPEGVSHAADTMDRKETDTEGMRQVCGVGGTKVYTTNVFSTYLHWMENHIARYPKIEWYNLSTKGARIKGTKELGSKVLDGSLL